MLPSIPFSVIPFLLLSFLSGMWIKCPSVASYNSSSSNSSDEFCILPIIPNSIHNLSVEDSFKIVETGETRVPLGTVVRYRCLFKYSLQGPIDTYECMENTGRWSSNAFPICEPIMCGPPPSIENGSPNVYFPKMFPIGTRVRYTCYEGYTIPSFREYLYCNIEGQWRFGYSSSDWSRPKCVQKIGSKAEDYVPTTVVRRNFDRNGTRTFDYNDGKTEFAIVMFGIVVVTGAILCGFRKGGVCRPDPNGTQISYDFSGDFPLTSGDNNRRRTTDRYHDRRQLPTTDIPTIAAENTHPFDILMKSQTPPPRYEEAPPSYEEATRTPVS